MEETDRRVRRTQKLLGQALIAVALEKGYDHITIQDVTGRADVGYRTYFRHYSGIDELLVDVAQASLDELDELLKIPLNGSGQANLGVYPEENGEILFKYIRENSDIFRVLLLERGVRFCLEPVINNARQQAEDLFSGLADDHIPVAIAANHLVDATFALIRWWLENDMPYSPKRMGSIFASLIMHPTWQAVTPADAN